MAATTSSSAPKLTLVQATLVQAVSPLTLADKVAVLNTELGLTSTAISKPAVEAIAAMLGMAEAIKGKPLVEQVNVCYAAVFSTVSDPSAEAHCGVHSGVNCTGPLGRRSTEPDASAVVNRTATDPAVITVVTGTFVAPAPVGPMAAPQPQPMTRQPPPQQIARASNTTGASGSSTGPTQVQVPGKFRQVQAS